MKKLFCFFLLVSLFFSIFGSIAMLLPKTRKIPSEKTNKFQTAIVMVAKQLDYCTLSRMLLIKQNMEKHDCFFFTSPQYLINNTLKHSLEYQGIQVVPQPKASSSEQWNTFGSKRSGFSKSSFLFWANSTSKYHFFWHIEEDTIFTGIWAKFFEHFENDTSSDLIATYNIHKSTTTWWGAYDCYLEHNSSCFLNGSLLQIKWPILRISKSLIGGLVRTLNEKNGGRGHHEALTGQFCASSEWCKVRKLESCFIGKIALDPNGQKSDIVSTESFDKLFHPVKCIE